MESTGENRIRTRYVLAKSDKNMILYKSEFHIFAGTFCFLSSQTPQSGNDSNLGVKIILRVLFLL